ncbi:MAG: guanylate kinase [Rhodospirillales bacterium]|nr:guanylate kinase [Rhodospirillales bacterium]
MTDRAEAALGEGTYLGGEERGVFFVLSGPGGTGKSTLIRRWRHEDKSLGYVRNYTSRQRRKTDPASGIDDADWFHFITTKEFRQLVEQDFFVQWSNAAKGYCSGTPIAPLHEAIEKRQDLVFDYTPQLFINLRRLFREHVVGIFIVPPTLAELKRRLSARGSEGGDRFQMKYQMGVQDLAFMDEHDYLVVNDDLDKTLATLKAIRLAEKCRIANMRGLAEKYRRISPRSMLFYYDPFGQRVSQIDAE